MSLLESLIRRLLADQKTVYFDDSPIFREQILNHSEAVPLLVQIMLRESPALAGRAGEMLSLFSQPAWKPLLDALPPAAADERTLLLGAAWAVAQNSDPEQRSAMSAEAMPVLRALLRDKARPDPDTSQTPVEIEYPYLRVCDQAYLLLRYLENPFFDETLFRSFDDTNRDLEIQHYNRRQDLPVA
ncbi:MAG TPA: hypothetical protein VMJ64_18785 [Anaerolineales bacterium]|nr:hypothetical protein [Anaerolineales bacterium]